MVMTIAHKLSGRYVFVRGYDEEFYMIPIEWKDEFDGLVTKYAHGHWEQHEWKKFKKCLVEQIHEWSFENPEKGTIDYWAV